MFVRYGLGDELQDRILQYQRALHDLTNAIALADRSGQHAAADQLRVQFVNLTAEINALIRQKRARDQAPGVLDYITNPLVASGAVSNEDLDNARLAQTQRDVKQAARDVVIARQKKQPAALDVAKKDFQRAAVAQTQAVAQVTAHETPSSFSLGLADLGASFEKVLPILALGVGAALVLPIVLPRRR
jgi:hypothetical protein